MHKLSSLSKQDIALLVYSQKATLLGHDNYRRFGARFPLHIRFAHNLPSQSLPPGKGTLCYLHQPVMAGEPLIVELSPLQTAGLQPSTIALTTAVYDINDPMTLDYSSLDAFVVLIGLEGSCELTDHTGRSMMLCEGESVLIPAVTRSIRAEGSIRILEVYL
ncbi:MAG: hypothetical protein K6G08_07730, partial [Prevotella sp.]|nr:hypothetical protein [Prevotella sp.]